MIIIINRRQKKAMEVRLTEQQDSVVQVVGGGHENMAFRNALYDETNRVNSMLEGSTRQQMPLPYPTSSSFPGDDFYPVKPGQLREEEQGAVGGCAPGANPYQDIDGYLDPKAVKGLMVVEGAVGGVDSKGSPTEQKQVLGRSVLDTRTLAGGGEDLKGAAALNPYSDFEDLKRRSVAARQTSGVYFE